MLILASLLLFFYKIKYSQQSCINIYTGLPVAHHCMLLMFYQLLIVH